MTIVKATSEEWQVWELEDSGLKMRRKPSKDKTSYEKCGYEDRKIVRWGDGQQREYLHQKTPELGKSGEVSRSRAGPARDVPWTGAQA